LTKADIPPGGEGKIEVSFNSGHRKGRQHKTVTVVSNDPVNPKARLKIEAFVEVEFDFTSYVLDFGTISDKDTVTKSVFLSIKNPQEAKITDITTSTPFIVARQVGPVDMDSGRAEIEITVLPGLPYGRINGTVTVHSNLESKPQANLRIMGRVIGDVEVTPDVLFFTFRGSKEITDRELQKRLMITNRSKERSLKILGIADPDGRMDIELKMLREGQQYQADVTLKRQVLEGKMPLNGFVVINTDNPKQSEIKVRYTVVKRNK
jgi:hypothetical protein